MLILSRRPARHRRRIRRRSSAVLLVGCAALGAVAATLLLPRYSSHAAVETLSTTYMTGTNLTGGSTASSADAPGGAKTGTAKPGDTLRWVVDYQNNAGGSAQVDLKDDLSTAGAYVPGSLQLPPDQNAAGTVTPQYLTPTAGWTAGAPSADATGVGFTGTLVPQGTQQLSPPLVAGAPPKITAVGAGDGYNIVVRNGLAYTVFHHRTAPIVYCARLDGTTCPGWPTGSNAQSWSATPGTPIGTGTAFGGKTPQQTGAWLSGSRLLWYAGLPDNSSTGIACLDLAPGTPTSCGYWARGGITVDNNTYGAQINGSGVAAGNGNTYSTAISNGTAILVCTTPAMTACPGATLYPSGVTSSGANPTETFGDYVFSSVQKTPTSAWQTFCFTASTSAFCPGTWPTTTSIATAANGTPFAPILSTGGAVTGVCTITNGAGTASSCWNLSGATVADPYAGTGANYSGGGNGSGDAYARGTKVYLSNGNQVMCRDFAAYTGTGTVPPCEGFVNVDNGVNYTVRDASDISSSCLVATGDAGVMSFFDPRTGGTCPGPSSPQSLTVSPPSYYCGTGAASFTKWRALTLPGVVPTAFADATVTLRDQNANAVPGFSAVTLAPTGSLNLQSIPTTVTSLTADVRINGVTNATGVVSGQISISWVGDPPQLCFDTIAPPVACDAPVPLMLSNSAVGVTTFGSTTDAPAGNPTGTAQFAVRADVAHCSLAVRKTSSVPSVRPGDTVEYTVTITNTGSQAYVAANISDDLTDVLKDATYKGDQTATAGTVSYAAPNLSWTGPLAVGAHVSVTYSVTVKNLDPGDLQLVNTVVSPSEGSNCAAGSTDASCTAVVDVVASAVSWHKVDGTAAANVLEGAIWTLTPIDATRKPTGSSIVVTDCVAPSASACTGRDADPLGGVFAVTGLGPGAYELVETRAPVGFRLDPTPIPVTVGASATTVALPDVVNRQLPVPAIPFTGGLGTDTLSLAGGGLLSAVLLLGVWQFVRRTRSA
ncbi:SpaA isopeptide-forming pilin-related protein [Leifsonia sp. fls2-241-R2A-40a]|uniref:DUF7927 domain-containing protein n=1 Tax=Leifsonia sp. fls2-241-R2A-40a TaxID=3040290 RepID=UPI00254E3586|nr:SpaA isopeptide-forming pilin-related protein [Leifsonia sp. fls2-241-R2A-40a]